MRCDECSKKAVCFYHNKLREMIFSRRSISITSFAGLVSGDGEKYEGMIDWYNSFADYCPEYEFKDYQSCDKQ